MERRKRARGRHQRFIGSWGRLNCEEMPVIPAWLVRRNLDDPREIPYLLVWKDEVRNGKIMEAVRLARFVGTFDDFVEVKRSDGSVTVLRVVWRMLPRNGGRALLLLCPHCEMPRRHFYGWEWDSVAGWSNTVRRIGWRCRSCARLRYSSEGGSLRPAYGRLGQLGGILRASWGNLPRPQPWLPYVFTSAGKAAEAGLCTIT